MKIFLGGITIIFTLFSCSQMEIKPPACSMDSPHNTEECDSNPVTAPTPEPELTPNVAPNNATETGSPTAPAKDDIQTRI